MKDPKKLKDQKPDYVDHATGTTDPDKQPQLGTDPMAEPGMGGDSSMVGIDPEQVPPPDPRKKADEESD